MRTRFARSSKLVGAAVAAAIMLVPAAAVAAEPTVNWQINLTHGAEFPQATGGAQYQSQPGQRELQVEVERIASLKGKTVSVCVNNAEIGTAKVSARGIAQLSRNTELHQTVPVISHGSAVSVTTGARCTGKLVASGTFA